ncbi:MAG: hypothetical protein WA985_02455 [Erythrobacter sp.]
MKTVLSRKRSSSLALAIALATGTATVTTAVFPAEASAQRNRDRDRDAEEVDGGGYGDAFREVYVPLDEAMKAEGADVAALRPQIDALIPLLNTGDEKLAGGNLVYNAGVRLQDNALRLRGMELMLESGIVPAANLGQYNFVAYQLSAAQDDYARARPYLQAAIDNNFTTEGVSAADLQISMAESYFGEERYQEGFNYLREAIEARKAAGQPVDEVWYRRGFVTAYNNEVTPDVYDFAAMWVEDYPTQTNWSDAINATRNINQFQNAEMLDLFRLSRRVDALQNASEYDYYVEAADARRLPGEVKAVIEEGIEAGVVQETNSFIAESLETANSRVGDDRADLPSLEQEAMSAGADLRTVTAAASAFLSYDRYDTAATLYEKALDMPGADRNEVLTRLGISQAGAGNYDAALSTFDQVTGTRMPIARLWSAYARQMLGGGVMGAAAGVEAASAAPEMAGS